MNFNPAEIRELEASRLWSLVEPDLELAQRLHADEYELITPTGTRLSKELYLGLIASGRLVYRVFEPVSGIAVRGGGDFALVRYRARIGLEEGDHTADFVCWHLDSYEFIDGRWQAVWSQATKTTSV
jgi:hypothetical protein